MVALRSGDIDGFLARPDPRRPIVLVYGPDLGLVRERVETLLRSAAADKSDPFAVIAIEGDALAADPGRLADEARTFGLFGTRRTVHVRAGARSFNAALEPLVSDPPDSLIVIEAGDLRKNAPLRTLLESARTAAVIACYADTERDLLRLIEQTVTAAGLAIEPEARDALVSLLGGDRRATRSELDKLVLYADGATRIGLDDIRAVIADASALALDDVVDAAAAGEPGPALAALAKTRNGGVPASTVLGAVLRHIALLHRMRLRIDQGESIAAVVERPEFRIHFRRKVRFQRALARFGTDQLARKLVALGAAALDARRTAALADAIAEREILRLAGGRRRAA